MPSKIKREKESKEAAQENKAVNQWLEINNRVTFHKRINTGLIILSLMQVFMIFYLFNLPPLVVTIKDEEKNYYIAERKTLEIEKRDIAKFINDFILIYHQWDNYSDNQIIKNISPFLTKGLKNKLAKTLRNTLTKSLQNKNARQGVTNLKVTVSDKQVSASFDKVLRVNQIPLVIPESLSFQLIKGQSTRWNKQGLYINGITKHEGE